MADVRLVGDVCMAAYFGAEKDEQPGDAAEGYRRKVDAWKAGSDRLEIDGIVEGLRGGGKPVLPLHWEIEFPEVLGRGDPGFDAMVGNPPFLGGKKISGTFSSMYLQALKIGSTDGQRGTGGLSRIFLSTRLRVTAQHGLSSDSSQQTLLPQGDTRTSSLTEIWRQRGQSTRQQGGDPLAWRRGGHC